MNILFIKYFFVGFIVYEIPRVSLFGHYPYSVTIPYKFCLDLLHCVYQYISVPY